MNTLNTPKATDYHRWPAKIVNRAFSLLGKVGIARFSLDEESLIAAAKKQTGLVDFGADQRFIEPMRVLLASLENEARLNPIGRFIARANVVRLLKHRLLVEDLLNRHPEILLRERFSPHATQHLALKRGDMI